MKKLLALIMVAAMIATFASVVSATELPSDGLVANYTFNNGAEAGLITDGGNNVEYKDGKAYLNGGTALVSGVDFKGYTALSVVATFDLTKDVEGTNWLFTVDSDETFNWDNRSFVGLNLNVNNDGGIMTSYAVPGVNVWCNGWGVDYAPATLTAGTTYTVAVTFGYEENGEDSYDHNQYTGYFHSLYVNGEQIQHYYVHDGESAVTLDQVIGDSAKLYIGKANVGEGEYSDLLAIDNIAVYNRALTKDEGIALSAAAPTGDTTPEGGNPAAPTPTAPKTGFATVALAIAAISSGAYVVSKKH